MSDRKPRPIGAFADCIQVMNKALEVGGLRLPFETSPQATTFRHRCYRARARMQHDSPQGASPYDSLNISKEDNILIIKPRLFDGVATDLEGNPVDWQSEDDLGEMPDFDLPEDLFN